MSAPRTNIKKQRRRHIGPLVGIVLMLLVAGGLIFGYLVYGADTDETPAPQMQTDDPSVLPNPGTPSTPMVDPSPDPSVIAPPTPPQTGQ